jgi:hypothetical protein
MSFDFSSHDKKTWKCLQNDDGSIYYGQVVHCLSATDPKPDKLEGFDVPQKGDESRNGGRLVVKDLSLVPDDIQAKLHVLRHG